MQSMAPSTNSTVHDEVPVVATLPRIASVVPTAASVVVRGQFPKLFHDLSAVCPLLACLVGFEETGNLPNQRSQQEQVVNAFSLNIK